MDKLAGKEFFVFSNTFNESFLEVLSFILPQSIDSLFENELMSFMSELNTRFFRKYAFAFVAEAKHFLQSNPEISDSIASSGG